MTWRGSGYSAARSLYVAKERYGYGEPKLFPIQLLHIAPVYSLFSFNQFSITPMQVT